MPLADWEQLINNAYTSQGMQPYFKETDVSSPWEAGGTAGLQSVVSNAANTAASSSGTPGIADWEQTINNAYTSQGKDPYFKSTDTASPWESGGTAGLQAVVNNTPGYGNQQVQTAPTTSPTGTNYTADVQQLYRQQMGREADPDGLAYYTKGLQNGTMTVESIVRAMQQAQGRVGPATPTPTPTPTPAPVRKQFNDKGEWTDFADGELQENSGGVRFNPRTGRNYQAQYEFDENGQIKNLTGYISWEPHANRSNEGAFVRHDASGNVTGDDNFNPREKTFRNAILAAGGVAGVGFGGAALLGAGGGGVGPGFSAGFTDLGTAGGALDTAYAGGTASAAGVSTAVQTAVIQAGLTGPAADAAVKAGTTAGTAAAAKGITGAALDTVIKGAITGVVSLVTGGGGFNVDSLLGVLGGLYDKKKQEGASNEMLDWMKSQQAKIDGLYAPGSPEHTLLQQTMERKDAAAGRNSQYGPRAVDLAAKIAEIKANNTAKLTTGLAGNWSTAINQKATAGSGISAAIGNLLKGGGSVNSVISGLSRIVKEMGGVDKIVDLGGGIKMNPDGSIDVSNSTVDINGTSLSNQDILDMIGYDESDYT